MRFRVIGRNEQTETEVVRDIVCDTPEDAEAVAVLEGILVERIESFPDSTEPPASAAPSDHAPSEPRASSEAADHTPPLLSSADTAGAKEPSSPPEFGVAPLAGLPAPLADPLRALRGVLGWLMLLQLGLTVYLLATQEHKAETLAGSAGAILLTFAFWRLLPNRPVNAFYLRSFRHDTDTWAMRRTLAAALGPGFRLSGIRDPRRRSIKVLRYLTMLLFTLRYATPKYMNLEAGADWKQRLWRSLGDARLAVIDVSDLTSFVAEEIRLCARCLGLQRVLFVASPNKDAEVWKAEINQVLNRPPDAGQVHLATWHNFSASGRQAFAAEVRRFAAQVSTEPAGLRHDAFPLSLSKRGLWTALTTPLDTSDVWVWGEVVLGLALASVLWTVFRKELHGMVGQLTGRNLHDVWFLPALVIPVLGLALCELWLFVMYLKDCGTFQERCLTLLTFGLAGLVGVGAPVYSAVEQVRDSAVRVQSQSNLKQIFIALLNYNDANRRLPPAMVYDRDGKPLYSWRVLLLPYIEEGQLYREFHLDEPWDSPHNKPLLARMPRVYAGPRNWPPREPYATHYQVFDGPGAAFDSSTRGGLQPFPLEAPRRGGQQVMASNTIIFYPGSFAEGTANTFLVVEAADAVPWSKPADLPWDPRAPLPKLGGISSGGFNAAFAGGPILRFLPKTTDDATLRAYITIAGGEPLNPP